MNKIVNIVLAGLFLTLSACSNKPDAVVNDSLPAQPKPNVSVTKVDKNKDSICEECVELVDKIVRNSDYDTYFKENYKKDYSILINEATKEKVTIQIVIENDVPMGWLELLINQGTLNDITNDQEEPKNLRGNSQMMQSFKQKCLQCCLD